MDRMTSGRLRTIGNKAVGFFSENPIAVLLCLSLISGLCIFSRFIFGDDLFVYTDCNMDTYLSYIPTLELIINYFRNGMAGSLMNFSYGLGGDMLSVLQYACEPFSAIVVIVGIIFGPATAAYTQCYAQILAITLSAYFCYKFLELLGCKPLGNIIGSYCFAFSGYMIGAGQHYQFAAMTFFTVLCLYKLEAYIADDKKYPGLVLAFSLLFIRGFYFAVMVGVMLAVYYLLRMISLHTVKDIKLFLIRCFRTVFFIFISFGISLFINLQGMKEIIVSGRVDSDKGLFDTILGSFHMNDLKFIYNTFLRSLSEVALGTANNYRWNNSFMDPHMFMGIICIFCTVMYVYDLIAVKGKLKNKILCLTAVFLTAFSLTNSFIPLLVHVFSYATYRFTVTLMPFLAYCIAAQVPRFSEMTAGKMTAAVLTALAMITAALFSVSGSNSTVEIIIQASIVLIIVALLSVIFGFSAGFSFRGKNSLLNVLLILIVFVNMTFDGFVSTNVQRSVWTKDYYETYHDDPDTEAALNYIKAAEGDEFYRADHISQSGRFISPIDYSYMKGYRSVSFYSSTMSEDIYSFKAAFGNPSAHIDLINWYACGTYGAFFDIPTANALGIKYILSDGLTSNEWPMVFSSGDVMVFQNPALDNAARVYTNYITESDFSLLEDKQKQIILSQAAVVEDGFAEGEAAQLMHRISAPSCTSMTAELMKPENIQTRDVTMYEDPDPINGSFSMSSLAGGSMTWYNTEQADNKNYFLNYNIFLNNGSTYANISFELENGETYQNTLMTDNTLHSFDFPAGWRSFTISFEECGAIFEKMELLSYEKLIQPAEGSVINKKLGGSISADIVMPVSGMLYLPVEYKTGWHTSDNSDIIKSNFCFSGIMLNEGENNITLSYKNDLFRTGMIASCLWLAVYIVYYLLERKLLLRRKKQDSQGE